MALSEFLPFCIIGLYFLGTVLFATGSALRSEALKMSALGLAGTGFALQSIELGHMLATLDISLSLTSGKFVFTLLGWGILSIFLLLWWRLGLKFLAVVALPLALVFSAAADASIGVQAKLPPMLTGLFFFVHIGTLLSSIALLGMAFGAGVAFIHLEKRIKTKSGLKKFQKDMPSLDTFDRVNHLVSLIGFPLYSLGLVSGYVWAWMAAKRVFSLDPKEILALIVLLLYAYLFHQRVALGWRGRKPAIMAIIVFLLTVVSMLGVNFLIPSTFHGFKP